jgi:isovaleryl-CoA dehydrogenase
LTVVAPDSSAIEDLIEAVRGYCTRRCGTPSQRDELTDHGHNEHNPELYREMARLGWFSVSLPQEYGGGGLGLTAQCRLLEETQRAMAPVGAIGVTLVVAGTYVRLGTEQQKREVLEGIGQGDVHAISVSEPGSGSDVAGITCRARREGDRWIINGQKTWCSYAHLAREILLVARTEGTGRGHNGLTLLRVPADAQGIETRIIPTMGGAEVNDIFFQDCAIPSDSLVGVEGQAWPALMQGLNEERLIGASIHLGLAQRAFDDTLAYVRQRQQFGQPIGSFQALSQRLADMATEIECARLLVYSVAAKVDADPHAVLAREASMAKLKATEVAKHVALEGMQMMGGYGYATEYEMERLVRRALVGTIYGGTSEIQRNIIARTLGL